MVGWKSEHDQVTLNNGFGAWGELPKYLLSLAKRGNATRLGENL